MSNFGFLRTKKEYELFAPACAEAEKIYASAPAMCAVGCRKALELAVKWVYAADKTMTVSYTHLARVYSWVDCSPIPEMIRGVRASSMRMESTSSTMAKAWPRCMSSAL